MAACFEPGVSVSRLALEHGVNANLLRKRIKSSICCWANPLSFFDLVDALRKLLEHRLVNFEDFVRAKHWDREEFQ